MENNNSTPRYSYEGQGAPEAKINPRKETPDQTTPAEVARKKDESREEIAGLLQTL